MSTPAQSKEWRRRLKSERKCMTCAASLAPGSTKVRCDECLARIRKVRCDECLARIRNVSNAYNLTLKFETIAAYGGKCSGIRTTGACGESEVEILEIDHIAGGGTKHREESGLRGVNFYRALRRDGWPLGYRVLCRNCNWLAHRGRLVK